MTTPASDGYRQTCLPVDEWLSQRLLGTGVVGAERDALVQTAREEFKKIYRDVLDELLDQARGAAAEKQPAAERVTRAEAVSGRDADSRSIREALTGMVADAPTASQPDMAPSGVLPLAESRPGASPLSDTSDRGLTASVREAVGAEVIVRYPEIPEVLVVRAVELYHGLRPVSTFVTAADSAQYVVDVGDVARAGLEHVATGPKHPEVSAVTEAAERAMRTEALRRAEDAERTARGGRSSVAAGAEGFTADDLRALARVQRERNSGDEREKLEQALSLGQAATARAFGNMPMLISESTDPEPYSQQPFEWQVAAVVANLFLDNGVSERTLVAAQETADRLAGRESSSQRNAVRAPGGVRGRNAGHVRGDQPQAGPSANPAAGPHQGYPVNEPDRQAAAPQQNYRGGPGWQFHRQRGWEPDPAYRPPGQERNPAYRYPGYELMDYVPGQGWVPSPNPGQAQWMPPAPDVWRGALPPAQPALRHGPGREGLSVDPRAVGSTEPVNFTLDLMVRQDGDTIRGGQLNVGHSWVAMHTQKGHNKSTTTYGFYPAEFNHDRPFNKYPGVVRENYDDPHIADAKFSVDISREQYNRAVDFIARSTNLEYHLLAYNCTTFAREVYKVAIGRSAPGKTAPGMPDTPAELRKDIERRNAAGSSSRSGLFNPFRRPGGSRDADLNPAGLPLGHALVLGQPRFGGAVEVDSSVVTRSAGTRTQAKRHETLTRFELPDPSRSEVLFGYDVSDTGEIHLLHDGNTVHLPADGWMSYGDDFLHGRGYLLRGDSGWIGQVENWDGLRAELPPSAMQHQLVVHDEQLYIVPAQGSRAVILPLNAIEPAHVAEPSPPAYEEEIPTHGLAGDEQQAASNASSTDDVVGTSRDNVPLGRVGTSHAPQAAGPASATSSGPGLLAFLDAPRGTGTGTPRTDPKEGVSDGLSAHPQTADGIPAPQEQRPAMPRQAAPEAQEARDVGQERVGDGGPGADQSQHVGHDSSNTAGTSGAEVVPLAEDSPATEWLGSLLVRLNEDVRPTVRIWERSAGGHVEVLKDVLAEPGSRSLVFGAQWGNPVWAINMAGTIRWFSLNAEQVPVPHFADGSFASIDIDRRGQLTGPAASVLKTTGPPALHGAKTGFCDLNMGVDLGAVLGWQARA
ncbi:hypothetical protein ACFYY2_22800 [Streptomyces sp. NPDC001822]|uniref:hypothetical protein n=1 Tax=Streptomyces sp. NPDC001822 TaxID=3364614 RepID=UPI003691A29F